MAYDFGVKHNILRLLVDRGCDIEVVPAKTSPEEVLKMNPDGIFSLMVLATQIHVITQ